MVSDARNGGILLFSSIQHPLLTNEMKESMAFQLFSISPPDEFCKGITVFKRNINRCSKLCDFIEPETWFIFECLRMDKDWLYDKPEQWTAYESFKKVQNFVANIKVVNDVAERTVKLSIFKLRRYFNSK